VDDQRVKRLVRALWLGLFAAAVTDALRNERPNGELFGFVPYDFRIPTLARIRARTWNPDLARVFTPQTFGVGWTVNLGRVARLARLA
jgi:Family of unknown function (DUF5808)